MVVGKAEGARLSEEEKMEDTAAGIELGKTGVVVRDGSDEIAPDCVRLESRIRVGDCMEVVFREAVIL